MITPASLQPGDRIAIVAPAGWIRPEYVEGASRWIESQGWKPVTMPHLLMRYGSFSAQPRLREADMCQAILDPDIRAILCARGGYGSVELLEPLDSLPIEKDPKWLIGYSDITALHGLWLHHGVESIHSPMARHLTESQLTDEYSLRLAALLRGERAPVMLGNSLLNREGEAHGVLVGGNLAVAMSLLATPFSLFRDNMILFIEDVGEAAYKVERMLWHLHLAGVLGRVSGLIVGSFTGESRPLDGVATRDVVERFTQRLRRLPAVFDAPIGHQPNNVPLIEGATVSLSVNETGMATLQYL